MSAGRRHAFAELRCEFAHKPPALRQQIERPQTNRTGECLADPSGLEMYQLCHAPRIGLCLTNVKYSIDSRGVGAPASRCGVGPPQRPVIAPPPLTHVPAKRCACMSSRGRSGFRIVSPIRGWKHAGGQRTMSPCSSMIRATRPGPASPPQWNGFKPLGTRYGGTVAALRRLACSMSSGTPPELGVLSATGRQPGSPILARTFRRDDARIASAPNLPDEAPPHSRGLRAKESADFQK